MTSQSGPVARGFASGCHEVAGDVTTLGRLEWEGPQARTGGEINAIGDRDWYRIRLEKGQTYQIDAAGRATGEGSLANPAVEVRSSTGTLLDFADDGGIGTNASLAFLARGGVYLAGGVTARVLPALQAPGFITAFRAKAGHSTLAASMPVHAVLTTDLGLRGALSLAAAAR